MNVALIGVIFLIAAGIIGAFLKPTEAEVRAGQQAAATGGAEDHGHGGHGGHDDHGHHGH